MSERSNTALVHEHQGEVMKRPVVLTAVCITAVVLGLAAAATAGSRDGEKGSEDEERQAQQSANLAELSGYTSDVEVAATADEGEPQPPQEPQWESTDPVTDQGEEIYLISEG